MEELTDGKELTFKEILAVFQKAVPEEVCDEMGLECGVCYFEAMMLAMAYRALNGDVAACSLVMKMVMLEWDKARESEAPMDEFSRALYELVAPRAASL